MPLIDRNKAAYQTVMLYLMGPEWSRLKMPIYKYEHNVESKGTGMGDVTPPTAETEIGQKGADDKVVKEERDAIQRLNKSRIKYINPLLASHPWLTTIVAPGGVRSYNWIMEPFTSYSISSEFENGSEGASFDIKKSIISMVQKTARENPRAIETLSRAIMTLASPRVGAITMLVARELANSQIVYPEEAIKIFKSSKVGEVDKIKVKKTFPLYVSGSGNSNPINEAAAIGAVPRPVTFGGNNEKYRSLADMLCQKDPEFSKKYWDYRKRVVPNGVKTLADFTDYLRKRHTNPQTVNENDIMKIDGEWVDDTTYAYMKGGPDMIYNLAFLELPLEDMGSLQTALNFLNIILIQGPGGYQYIPFFDKLAEALSKSTDTSLNINAGGGLQYTLNTYQLILNRQGIKYPLLLPTNISIKIDSKFAYTTSGSQGAIMPITSEISIEFEPFSDVLFQMLYVLGEDTFKQIMSSLAQKPF